MEEYKQSNAISNWAEEDRPREKLLLKGRQALTDSELIAILIGSGSPNESAVDLSKRILASAENNLNALAKLTIKELQKFHGIGEAKSISIAAALELGRRRQATISLKKPIIRSSRDAYNILNAVLGDLPNEAFWTLYLNQKNEVIHKECISVGGVSGTVADVRIIMQKAVQQLATGIIISHNHPSGSLKPSQADINITKRIKEAGKVLDVKLLDHIIVGDQAYLSFSDEGMI